MEHEEKKGGRVGRKACGEEGVFRDLVRRSSRRAQPEMRLLLSGRAGARNPRAITPPLRSSSLLRPRHRDVREQIVARLLTCCLFLLS